MSNRPLKDFGTDAHVLPSFLAWVGVNASSLAYGLVFNFDFSTSLPTDVFRLVTLRQNPNSSLLSTDIPFVSNFP